MNEPPQNDAESQELIDMLIAISVVSRHLARKVAEASALQRGKGFPCHSRPGQQGCACRDGERRSQQTRREEETHEQYERTGSGPG